MICGTQDLSWLYHFGALITCISAKGYVQTVDVVEDGDYFDCTAPIAQEDIETLFKMLIGENAAGSPALRVIRTEQDTETVACFSCGDLSDLHANLAKIIGKGADGYPAVRMAITPAE